MLRIGKLYLMLQGSGAKSLNYCLTKILVVRMYPDPRNFFLGSGSWGWCSFIVTAQYRIENSWVLMVLSWGQNQQFASNFQEPARPAIHALRLGLSTV